VKPLPIYAYLQAAFGVGLCGYPFAAIAMEALRCGWTTDPFHVSSQESGIAGASLDDATVRITRGLIRWTFMAVLTMCAQRVMLLYIHQEP
jgi:hypothetical protein